MSEPVSRWVSCRITCNCTRLVDRARQDESTRPALAVMPKIPRSWPNAVRVVELLAFPLVQLLDVTEQLQVSATANDLVSKREDGHPMI